MEFEDAQQRFEANTDVNGQVPFFAEITRFRQSSAPGPIAKIAQIVGVLGDARPGQQPFPHPFPARMPIEVAQAAVKAVSNPGDLILDCMSGSGVVPKAALLEGRRAIGSDIDPLAVIQGRALCAIIPNGRLESVAAEVLRRATKIVTSKKVIGAQWWNLEDEERKFVEYWFPKGHAEQLFALSLAMDEIVGADEWPIFATLFSSLIISRGSGASMAMDLSRSRPHRVDAKTPKTPFALWSRQVSAFRKYYEGSLTRGHASIKVGDARRIALSDETVDAIITSPPYLNAIDYMRTSKFSLIFLGSRLRELRAIRSMSVGTEVGLPAGQLPKSVEAMVENGVADPKRRPLVRRYLFDLREMLAESYRVLKPGGQALFVMGPSILSRRDYDAAKVLTEVANLVGFHSRGHGRRDLLKSRRSLPPPRRSARGDSMNKRMTCEFYVALSKDEG